MNSKHRPLIVGLALVILSALQFALIILSRQAGIFIIVSALAFLTLGIQMLIKAKSPKWHIIVIASFVS